MLYNKRSGSEHLVTLRRGQRVLSTYKTLLSCGLSLLLLPYIALAFYAQPYWDDYDFVNMVRHYGSHWKACQYLYLNHTGRFFTLALACCNPLTYNWPAGIKVVALATLLASGWVQAVVLRVLTRQTMSWGAALRWGAALLLVELAVLPSPNSAFYWFSGSMVYQIPVLLQLLWPVAALQSLRSDSRYGRVGWYTLAAVLVLGAAGANELSCLLLGWSLGWLSYLAYRRANYRALRCWLGLLVLALVAGIVAVAAPGNLARLHHTGGGTTATYWVAAKQAVRSTYLLFTEPKLLVALLVLPVLLAPLGLRYRHLRPKRLRLPLLAGCLFAIGGVGLQMLFLGFIAWGYPAVRTLNFIGLGLLFSWLIVLWAALPERAAPFKQHYRGVWALALVCVLLLGSMAERAAWYEWLHNADAWQQQLTKRETIINQATQLGVRQVAVPPLTGIEPQYVLILGETLSQQASASYNQDAAHYYRLDSLRLNSAGLPPADVRLH